jgi:hypothetical protein
MPGICCNADPARAHGGTDASSVQRAKRATLFATNHERREAHVGTAVPGCPAAQVYRAAAEGPGEMFGEIGERFKARQALVPNQTGKLPHPTNFLLHIRPCICYKQ